MKRVQMLLALMMCAMLSGCAGAAEAPQVTSNGQPVGAEATQTALVTIPQATPQTGKTTIVGQVVSTKTNAPISHTTIRLAEVYRGQEKDKFAYALDGAQSPGAMTDDKGVFVVPNIEAREYVLVIGDILGYYVVVSDGGKARVLAGPADKVNNLGEIKVDFAQ